jgi:hypothetical protein
MRRLYGLPVAGGYMVYPLGGRVVQVLAAPVALPAPIYVGRYGVKWLATHSVQVRAVGKFTARGLVPPSRAPRTRTLLVCAHAPGLRDGYAPCVL